MSTLDLVGQSAPAGPFQPLSDRIMRFRDESLVRAAEHRPNLRQTHLTEAFFERYQDRPFWERYARSMAHALESEPVCLFDDERLVGMLYQTGLLPAPDADQLRDLWRPYSESEHRRRRCLERGIDQQFVGMGAPGHVGWLWDGILERGVEEHVTLLRERLLDARDVEARRFYEGALILWRAVLRWNDSHVKALATMAASASGDERARLEWLSDLCRRVPRYPARTFHEAVQSCYFVHLAVMLENPYGGNGPGRLDVVLWPYLQRDLAAGRTTLAESKDLVDELFIRFHERLYYSDGWVEAVTVGGVGADGSSLVNPLSHLMVHSLGALDQTHPLVYTRLGRGTPEDWLDLNVRFLLHGHNLAQVYDDDACLPAIVKSGVSPEDASTYMAGGCMEISPQGLNCDLNFAGTHNVAKTLELVLNGGIDLLDGRRRIAHERTLADYGDFEDLYAAFESELARTYRELTRALDIASECYAEFRPTYLLSSLVGDCLDRGRDQQDGGARYQDYGFAPLGITSAADSLSAIKRAVYDEGFVSAAELLAAVRANYAGYESLRLRLNRLPKFGVEDVVSDAMCERVLRSVCTLATRPQTRFGGRLKPMIFNFVWTPGASRELGARGDGSRAGDLIGHGMTPRSCAMTEGVTAAINSATSLTYDVVSGGATTMWDMDADWIDCHLLKSLLKTFLARGGMIFQGNMTSVRELEEALEHPERYPNLIVRVGGFSARFVTLGRDLQEEVIRRRRHTSTPFQGGDLGTGSSA